MFSLIKRMFCRTPPVAPPEAKEFDLKGKPFSASLLREAAAITRENDRFFSNVFGWNTFPRQGHKNLGRAAQSAAVVISYDITAQAMANLGRPLFILGCALPNDWPMVISFSLCILSFLNGRLKVEGVKIDLIESAALTTHLFFFLHPNDERMNNCLRAVEVFKAFVKDPQPQFVEWQQTLDLLMWNTLIRRGCRISPKDQTISNRFLEKCC